MRKYFFTTATSLNLNRDIVRVLTFKSVSKDILTYWLNREDLREFWKKVINAIPLEPRANGRVTDIEETVTLVSECIAEMLRPIIERKLLERQLSRGGETLGLLRRPDLESMSAMDVLKTYLRLTKEEKEEK